MSPIEVICIDSAGTIRCEDGIFSKQTNNGFHVTITVVCTDEVSGITSETASKCIALSFQINTDLTLEDIQIDIKTCIALKHISFEELEEKINSGTSPQDQYDNICTAAKLLYLQRNDWSTLPERLDSVKIIEVFMNFFNEQCTLFADENNISIIRKNGLVLDTRKDHPDINKRVTYWSSPLRNTIAKNNINQLQAFFEKKPLAPNNANKTKRKKFKRVTEEKSNMPGDNSQKFYPKKKTELEEMLEIVAEIEQRETINKEFLALCKKENIKITVSQCVFKKQSIFKASAIFKGEEIIAFGINSKHSTRMLKQKIVLISEEYNCNQTSDDLIDA